MQYLRVITAAVLIPATVSGQDIRLEQFFKEHPTADLNGDGKLTREEAREYRKSTRRENAGNASKNEIRTKRYASEDLVKIYEAGKFKTLSYRFLSPEIQIGRKYPLILSLHGAGGKGSNNIRNLKQWNGILAEPDFQKKHPCFVVAPQSDQPWRVPGSIPRTSPDDQKEWSDTWRKFMRGRRSFAVASENGKLDMVFELLDALAREYPIDTNRVYIIGHSMGGFGTFEALAMSPDRFAAAIPSAGGLLPWHDPALFRNVPIWAFHGEQDRTVPIELTAEVFAQLRRLNGNMKFTRLGGVAHGASEFAFAHTGDKMNPRFRTENTGPRCDPTENTWDWLFAQRRPEKAKTR